MSATPPAARRFPSSIDAHEDKLMLAWTLVMAGLIGAVTVGFILVTEQLGDRLHPPGDEAAWRRLMIPILGSAVAGFLLRRFFPNSAGSGIPQTKAALELNDGYIPFRTSVGKFICSSITLASGISLGREGPSVQVGAGIASVLGRRLGLSPRRVAALLPAGAAAAVSAAFNTPIAAVLFTLEELVGNLHAPLLGSVVLSAATSWMVMRALLGDSPLFSVPPYQVVHPVEFVFYGLLGLSGGLVSAGFVKLLLWIRLWFAKLPANTKTIQPVAGGLLVGAIAWYIPEILGVGYSTVDQALNGKLLFQSMALLLGLKIIATAVCYSSGNAGGIFGPSLFIGGMLGGVMGSAAHYALPDLTGSIGAYTLAGMGAAFAGIVRAPLTSVIMIFEITRDYSIIVPLMISNLISFFVSQRLQPLPVYKALLEQDGIHLPESAAEAAAEADPSGEESPPPMRGRFLLVSLALALVLLIIGTTIYSYTSRLGREARAKESYEQGLELVRLGRFDEAIEELRNSLAVLRSDELRLALARALVSAGRLNEAGVHLRDVLADNPSSGPANLWLARVENATLRPRQAQSLYNRAIYGDWPAYSVTSRRDARWELAETLQSLGIADAAASELAQLLAEHPADRDLSLRVGQKFYEMKLYDRAAGVFGRLRQKDSDDVEATVGYARAVFATRDYRAAAQALRLAAVQAPASAEVARELLLAQQVSAASPLLRGLSRRERLKRSQSLLKAVRTSARTCAALPANTEAAGTRPATQEDAIDEAVRLWRARVAACPTVPPTERYLTLLFASREFADQQ